VRGRTFRPADHETDFGAAIVSREFAERFWPGEDPIGKRLRTAGDTTGWETVVGVVEGVRDRALRTPPVEMVYRPMVGRRGDDGQVVRAMKYVVRAQNPTLLTQAIRREIQQMDPNLPIFEIQKMREIVSDSVVRLSFTMMALGVSAFVALILGAVGLYGVLSYLVTQRTQEIGVRIALGAEASQVRSMVVKQGTRLAVVGIVVGLLGAAGLTRLLQGMLFDVQPMDPLTFGAMAGVMILVGMLASYLPARRASAVDPVYSMRSE